MRDEAASAPASVEILWIPLGAGQRVVKWSGRIFEALVAAVEHRDRADIYHAALRVTVPEGTYVIEMAPIRDDRGNERGVVAEGAVGMKWLSRFRLFRYEIRCWLAGVIPDANEATKTICVRIDIEQARLLLELLPSVPRGVWGRDQLNADDMWNSNSVVSWLLTRGGVDLAEMSLPPGGRAPGWSAGIVAASREVIAQVNQGRDLPEGTQAVDCAMR